MIDFTQCEIEHTKFYDGLNGKKLAIYYNDELYMLKFPKELQKEDNYASSTINEHISSNIFKILGFTAQDTLLGYYEGKIVVACKDFEGFDKRLINFGKIKNSIISGSSSSFVDTDLDETLNTIHNQKILNPKELERFYWGMFIADTLIANFDRHNGNWGVLADKEKHISIAPIYDCGSSLYPKLTQLEIEKYLAHQGNFNDLLLNQTTSAITINKKKINPQTFLKDNTNTNVTNALAEIHSKIDISKINNLIDSIEIISQTRKIFYKRVLKAREKFLQLVLKDKQQTIQKNDMEL